MSEEEDKKAFEEFKKKQAEDKAKAERQALIDEVRASIQPTLNLPKTIDMMPETPKPSATQSSNPLDKLNFDERKYVAIQYLKEKNTSQMCKIGIALGSFATAVASGFGMYAGLGVAFLFMLIGGVWFVWSLKEINTLKQKYKI